MRPWVLALLVASAGCAHGPPAEDVGTCDADRAMAYVGKTDSEAEAARKAAGARIVRVLKPGDMATMDYRPDRLTVDLDADGRIKALRCG